MFETVEILATSDEKAKEMNELAERTGQRVHKTSVWTGIVPPDSFIEMGIFRMARAEYMFFRKANQLDEEDAVLLGANLLCPFNTHLTSPSLSEGEVMYRGEPHMTYESMREYLKPVMDEPEAKEALRILELAAEKSGDVFVACLAALRG